MVNTGYPDEAVPVVRTFVDVFAGYDAVVTPSGSCAGLVRDQHRDRRPPAPGTRRLVDAVAAVVAAGLRADRVPRRRARRRPTSARTSRTGSPTTRPATPCGCSASATARPRLLEAVRGLELVELPGAEECCGFGGTFAVKNADVSAAMGADKVRHVRDTGAEVLCAADNSCLMHIGGTAGPRSEPASGSCTSPRSSPRTEDGAGA